MSRLLEEIIIFFSCHSNQVSNPNVSNPNVSNPNVSNPRVEEKVDAMRVDFLEVDFEFGMRKGERVKETWW